MCGKIVLADGDESVRRMVARVLESFGYEVLTATTAVEALTVCEQAGPDLLLADLELLAEPAKKTTDILGRQRPRIPILVMDAWANQARNPSEQQAFDAWVEKPLDLPNLIRIVQNLLQGRHDTTGNSPEEAPSLHYLLKTA